MSDPETPDMPADESESRQPGRSRPSLDVPPSVLGILSDRIGEAPRVSLREEPSNVGGAPVIDPSADDRAALPEGRGSYQVLGEIARGGMGIVLRGHDTDLGRDVAMKVLHKDLADRDEVVQRFVEEAQIGGQLQHPGIVPVYELGLMADDRPYFTMKLVKGRTLATLLAERETSASDRRRLLDVFESTCQTVAYAHSRGVIHRDLKPANIMVGAFGEVQVVDWGLAKVLARGGKADERRARKARAEDTILETVRTDGSSTGTESLVGSVIGTPAYMPPEQARGNVDRLDERADVFALGAILCEILTGHPPYVGDRGEILGKAAMAEIDDANARLEASGADAELVALAKQCLVAPPEARPRNAGVVAESVRNYLEGVEERAHAARIEAAEASVRAVQERRARKLTVLLAAAVVGVVGVGLGSWFLIEQQRAQQEIEATERRLRIEREVDEALGNARVLASSEDFEGARAAVEGARSVVSASGGVPHLDPEIAEVADAIDAREGAAERRSERERDTQRLVDALRVARSGIDVDPTLELNARDEVTYGLFPSIFAAHGIDFDGTAPAELAAEFESRGLDAEFALLLDGWASMRRGRAEEQGARHVLAVADLVDPDPFRAELREAVASGDREALRRVTAEDLAGQPAATFGLLIQSLVRLGDQPSAIDVAERAVAIHPGSALLQSRLTTLLGIGPNELKTPAERRRGRQALTHAWAAVAHEPESSVYRFYLGVILYQVGEYARAAEIIRSAEGLDDRYGWLRLLSVGILVSAEPFNPEVLEAAQGIIDEAEVPEQVFYARMMKAGLHEARGEVDAAVEELEAAVEMKIDIAGAYTELLQAYVRAGDLEGLERTYAQARPIVGYTPNDIAWILAVQDKSGIEDEDARAEVIDAAVGYAMEAAETQTRARNRWNTLGMALMGAEEYEGAVEAFEESIRERDGVGLAEDWIGLSICYSELGDAETALMWYRRARPHFDGTIDQYVEVGMREMVRRAARRLNMGSPLPGDR